MPRSPLDIAASLALRGKYAEIIGFLEPQLPLFRDSQRYFYLLGCACLRTNDPGGAQTYLRKAEQIDPRDEDTLLALAALLLRRGDGEKAIALYLEVLERRPRDRTAKKALAFLRRPDAAERVATLLESSAFAAFYPPARGLSPYVAPIVATLAGIAILVLLLPVALRISANFRESKAPRPEIAAISLSGAEIAAPIAGGGGFKYILGEAEAIAAFERAKSRFQEYRDNAALVEINRLLGSNASKPVKDKALTLKGFVARPDFRTVRDLPAYADVSRDPFLYDLCAVLWKGRAANLSNDDGELRFDFLVGYHDRKRLEGIVASRFADTAVMVPVERAFELLAIVHAEGSAFRLETVAIHELLQ